VDEVAATILGLGDGTRLNVLFPLHAIPATEPKAKAARGKKKATAAPPIPDSLKIRLNDLRQRGFNRLYQQGQIFEFSTPESLLDVNFAEPVFLLWIASRYQSKRGRASWTPLRAVTGNREK
jgi:excinuclease ABC subunit A